RHRRSRSRSRKRESLLALMAGRRSGGPTAATVNTPNSGGSFVFHVSGSRVYDKTEWRALSRTMAVHRGLAEIGEPATRAEIGRLLIEHGRDDDLDDVSAALSYLRRHGHADRKSGGRWVLLTEPPAKGVVKVSEVASG
ncbi:MAG: hypothetical protein KGR26_15925, partial [Cyanobacteria bacterium REEB65]|nr:hypothetical protein [Cyanobacteria bacterium REEB65]